MWGHRGNAKTAIAKLGHKAFQLKHVPRFSPTVSMCVAVLFVLENMLSLKSQNIEVPKHVLRLSPTVSMCVAGAAPMAGQQT